MIMKLYTYSVQYDEQCILLHFYYTYIHIYIIYEYSLAYRDFIII